MTMILVTMFHRDNQSLLQWHLENETVVGHAQSNIEFLTVKLHVCHIELHTLIILISEHINHTLYVKWHCETAMVCLFTENSFPPELIPWRQHPFRSLLILYHTPIVFVYTVLRVCAKPHYTLDIFADTRHHPLRFLVVSQFSLSLFNTGYGTIYKNASSSNIQWIFLRWRKQHCWVFILTGLSHSQ